MPTVEDFCQRYEHLVESVSKRVIIEGDRAVEAADVKQHLRLALFKSFANYDMNRGIPVEAYIVQRLLWAAGIFIRGIRFSFGVVGEATVDENSEDVIKRLKLEIVSIVGETKARPLFLHYLNGYSYYEIGLILGCSPNTVAVRVHRVLNKVRRVWFQDGAECED